MGLRPLPYWLGNLIADLILKLIMTIILVVIIIILYINDVHQQSLTNYDSNIEYLKSNIGWFICLYMACSFNTITLAYNIPINLNNTPLAIGVGPAIYLSGNHLLGSPIDKHRLFHS